MTNRDIFDLGSPNKPFKFLPYSQEINTIKLKKQLTFEHFWKLPLGKKWKNEDLGGKNKKGERKKGENCIKTG